MKPIRNPLIRLTHFAARVRRPGSILLVIMASATLLPAGSSAQTVLQPARSWTLPDLEPYSFAPSPDGRLVLVFDYVDALYVLDRTNGTSTEVARGQFLDLTWSPMGNRVAFMREPEGGGPGHIWTMPVDPSTGRPTGAPRRASMGPGHAPLISRDGSLIAFARMDDSASSNPEGAPEDLVTVPADGGPERVLYKGGGAPRGWSADGEWVFFPSRQAAGQRQLMRVRVSGGAAEPVVTGTGLRPGLSPDGQRIAFKDGPDRVIADASGQEIGRFRTADDGWGEVWAPNSNALLVGVARYTFQLRTLSIGTGTRKSLGPVFDGAYESAFSPDGREIAVITRTGDGPSIVSVIRVEDGSSRSYHTANRAIGDLKWSPDGTKLALRTGPVFFPGRAPDIGVEVIDLATGSVSAPVTSRGVLDLIWRGDGRAIRYVHTDVDEASSEVRETVLGGEDRLLHAGDGASLSVGFLDFDRVFLGAGTQDTARVILDLSTGRTSPRTEPGAGRPVRLANGTKWAQPVRPSGLPRGQTDALLVVDERTGEQRVIPMGLRWHWASRGSRVLWHPDGRHVIVSGFTGDADSTMQIRIVPIDGTPGRVLVNLDPTVGIWGVSLSPDGRTVAWSEASPPHGVLHEYDMTPLLSVRGN